MSLHDPYQIATMGQNSRNTFTLSTNGILVDVFIEDLPPIIVPTQVDDGSGGMTTDFKEIPRKKIKVVANIGGIDYEEVKIVEGIPNISIEDLDISILNVDKPKISITLKK